MRRNDPDDIPADAAELADALRRAVATYARTADRCDATSACFEDDLAFDPAAYADLADAEEAMVQACKSILKSNYKIRALEAIFPGLAQAYNSARDYYATMNKAHATPIHVNEADLALRQIGRRLLSLGWGDRPAPEPATSRRPRTLTTQPQPTPSEA